MNWLRGIKYGLGNLWRFRRVVWRWRGWDWQYSYDLFFCGLGGLRDHIGTRRHHEEWRRDVRAIGTVLRQWRRVQEDEGFNDEAWALLHDHLSAHARGWWD